MDTVDRETLTNAKQAAKRIVVQDLKLKDGENFVIIADQTTLQVAGLFQQTAEDIITHGDVVIIELDGYSRPIQIDFANLETTMFNYPALLLGLRSAQAIMYIPTEQGDEIKTLRKPVMAISKKNGIKIILMPALSLELLAKFLQSSGKSK